MYVCTCTYIYIYVCVVYILHLREIILIIESAFVLTSFCLSSTASFVSDLSVSYSFCLCICYVVVLCLCVYVWLGLFILSERVVLLGPLRITLDVCYCLLLFVYVVDVYVCV